VLGLTENEVGDFLAEFAALVEPVELHFRLRPQLTDAKDGMVLEAAIKGRARALITYNISDFAPARRRFRLPIPTPAQLLAELPIH